jgi:TolB-like protein
LDVARAFQVTRIKVEFCREEHFALRFVKARRVNPKNFFAELKRRNVYKVAIAYGVVAWLLMQVASQIFPFFEIPNWAVRLVVLLLIIGFPVALILAWAFELTPEGIKRTEVADKEPAKRAGHRAWIYIVLIGAALSVGIFFLGRNTASRKQAGSAELPAKSIAVLPFENLSEEKGNAYFADGIQEEILTRLAKIADLKVISRTSTQQFQSKPANLSEIAKQLGVANILEGSVQRSADQVRVNVQLIRAATDAHLWADTFDRKLTDIFAVESDIATAIAETLQAKLTGSEKRAIAAQPTENTDAHEAYLKGRYFWNKRTAKDFKTAITYFQQAIDKDPNYALAYVGLADCYLLLEEYAGTPTSETLPKARPAVLRALQIDNSLAEAHTSLGFINEDSWQFGEAEKEYKRGIELNPNYPTAHHWYSAFLHLLGQLDEAMAESQRAQQLDPLSPVISDSAVIIYFFKGDLNAGIEQCKKNIELNPNYPRAHSHLGWAYLKQGREQEAIVELQKAVEVSARGSQELGYLGYGYGALGKRAEAMAVLRELEEKYAKKESPAMYLAAVYAGLGENDQAFAWLERDFQARTGMLIYIAVRPVYDTLRSDPRYTDLRRRMGLKP